MNILVTGGAGFIGSNIVDRLVMMSESRGDLAIGQIIVIDNLSSGSLANINKKAVFHNIDINDKESEKLYKNIDVVIHHAANVFVTKSLKDPVFDATQNILGSLNVLENCRKHGVKKIIYANSGGAGYGEPVRLPVDEEHIIKPLAPYGASKHTVEHYLEIYKNLYGLKYTSLRYANIYGPRQNPAAEGGVIAIFINRFLKNESPIIKGDGEQTRDFVFVNDVVDANILAMSKGDNDYFNISTGSEITINQLTEMIKKLTKSSAPVLKKDGIEGEIKRSVLSCKKAERFLGWKTKTPLVEGLKKSVEYYKGI